MLSPLAVFWYQILLSPICSCIEFQVWFYFTWLQLFTPQVFLHEIRGYWNCNPVDLCLPLFLLKLFEAPIDANSIWAQLHYLLNAVNNSKVVNVIWAGDCEFLPWNLVLPGHILSSFYIERRVVWLCKTTWS